MNNGLRRDYLFDLGNTRLKHAELREDGTIGEAVAVANDDADPDALPSGQVAWLSSVAGSGPSVDLIERLTARFQRICMARTQSQFAGVRIAYAEPECLGVDRFLALLAAHARGLGDCLVVGVGTALTIDLLDATGGHVGGRIAPSPTLMREMLQQRISQLPKTGGQFLAFADTTDDALASGCQGAALALIEKSLQMAGQQLGRTPCLLLHGGGAESLHEYLPAACLARELVLEGLAVWARATASGH